MRNLTILAAAALAVLAAAPAFGQIHHHPVIVHHHPIAHHRAVRRAVHRAVVRHRIARHRAIRRAVHASMHHHH